MEAKQYAQVSKSYVENANVWRAYARGDRAAGEVVDSEVKKRMQRTSEDYSTALRALRSEHADLGYKLTSRPRPEVSHDTFVNSGKELQDVVDDLSKTGVRPVNGSYLKDALHMNPHMAEKLGYFYSGADADELLAHYRDGAQEVKLHGQQSALSKLWGLIGGNKRDDGSIDWVAATTAAKLAPEIARDAAREAIDKMANLWIIQQGLPGPTVDHIANAKATMRRQNRELAAQADDGADTTAESLRQAYPQFVKLPGSPKQTTGVGTGF